MAMNLFSTDTKRQAPPGGGQPPPPLGLGQLGQLGQQGSQGPAMMTQSMGGTSQDSQLPGLGQSSVSPLGGGMASLPEKFDPNFNYSGGLGGQPSPTNGGINPGGMYGGQPPQTTQSIGQPPQAFDTPPMGPGMPAPSPQFDMPPMGPGMPAPPGPQMDVPPMGPGMPAPGPQMDTPPMGPGMPAPGPQVDRPPMMNAGSGIAAPASGVVLGPDGQPMATTNSMPPPGGDIFGGKGRNAGAPPVDQPPQFTNQGGDIFGAGGAGQAPPSQVDQPPQFTNQVAGAGGAGQNPITIGSNGYSTTTPGRPFLLGFETSKLVDPNKGPGESGKYTAAAKGFGQAYLGGVDIARGNLQPMIDAMKSQFPNAKAVGDDKIDFGDGDGPIDVIRSDGTPVFQNTTGNPNYEQRYAAGQVGHGSGAQPGATTNAFDLPPMGPGMSVPPGGGGAQPGAPATGAGAGNYTFNPVTGAQDFTPTAVQGPSALNLGSLQQPGAVTAQSITAQGVQSPQQIAAQQVQGPAALGLAQLGAPNQSSSLTADEFANDPGVAVRQQRAIKAAQQGAAAKGLLASGGFAKGLADYVGDSTSQEYAAADARKQGLAQQNFQNQFNVTGANNAANAQAYGLTNQYQQQAQLANQSANLNASQFNVNTGQQAGMFNATQGQQAQSQNASNQLNAGQFNAGMNFQTQQGNIQNQLAAYNAYQPLAQQNQQFNAAQQASAAQNNFQNRFATEQFNATGGLNAYNANLGAELGRGNLALGYGNLGNAQAQTANSYNLGQGQLALGNRQADQSYQLGLGNLGVSQGSLGLAGQAQAFNQSGQTFDRNYGVYRDNRDTAFNQAYSLAGLGQNAAGGYGNAVGGLYAGQGNANGAAAIGQGNAAAGGVAGASNATQAAFAQWLASQGQR